ncbi:CLUMA_CG016743, isoform A [Clunio marinus]|uniref:CLUMA_CG016743, isoform A n=1 Tax=Clunio marinus TaxID=568069 RepID=A0A1J1ITU6_9DIPT|nr:CLUMA_CG016743, isoform A [Clunio marinus]
MDITTVELHGAGPSTGSGYQRRRPPKLKSVDRTVSMIVDNYTPLTSAALSAKNAGPLVINMDQPLSSSRRSSPNINEEIFKAHSQSSNSMDSSVCMSNSMDNDYPPPPPVLRKSSSFRRGETIDMMDLPSTTSTSLQHLRKNSSFHSAAGDDTVQIVPLSRHYSVRHRPTTVYPTSSFQSVHHPHQQQEALSRNSSSSRRNCSMHRSFHDPSQKRMPQNKRDAAVKSNSFSSDEQQQPVASHLMYQQQHSSMQFQPPPSQMKHSSIESELYRSRSNSRSNSQCFDEQLQYLDVWKPSPMPSPSSSHFRKTSNSPRPSSSNSLDQVLSQGSVSPRALMNTGTTAKMLRHQHTVAALNPQFLAPIPLLALDKSFDNVYQVKSPVFDMKKSYSLKYKNGPGTSKENRELFKSRKSKSFITDKDPLDVPFGMSPNLSPAGLSASGSIKKHHSPLISPLPVRGSIILEEMKRRSGDGADLLPPNPGNFPIEFGTLDFNTIYKSYRAQQKSANRREKYRRKKSSSSLGQKGDDDFESQSITKRKRIVCIVMIVFLSLALFAVLAVIVTLTHHVQVSHVQNQTRQVYTFARDSRPIHYPVGGGSGGN